VFRLYAGDHEGAAFPHVHARFDRGEVVIELLDDRTVRLSLAHREAISGSVKRADVRRALDAAELAYDVLLDEWEAMRKR
jgi:hypothetical protein